MESLNDFVPFMRTFQDMVYATALRLVGNESDAADIAQETFLKAHQHFAKLVDNPKAGGWLKTVATNLSLNHLTRYRARWSFFSELGREDQSLDWNQLASPEDHRADIDHAEHRRFFVERALRRLPPAQRVPLVLFHFEEMSYEEIAAKLRVSLSKVKTDIHRARESLRAWLSPHLDENHSGSNLESHQRDTDHDLHRGLFAWPSWSEGTPNIC